MIELLLITIAAVLIAIHGFDIVIFIIRLWTGCDRDEAIKKLHHKINGTVYIPLGQDPGLWSEIWDAIRKIIGDARFEKLQRIYEAIASSLGGIRLNGHHSGLPYIIIIIDLVDDAEKKLIETVVVGIVKRHLRMRGLPDSVIVTWGQYGNGLEHIEIRFGETGEQQTIVRTVLADELRQFEADTYDRDF